MFKDWIGDLTKDLFTSLQKKLPDPNANIVLAYLKEETWKWACLSRNEACINATEEVLEKWKEDIHSRSTTDTLFDIWFHLQLDFFKMSVINNCCQDDYWEIMGHDLHNLLHCDALTDLRFVTMDSSGKNVHIIKAHQFLFCHKSPLLQEICHEARTKQLISDPVILTLPGVKPSSVLSLVNYFYFGIADFAFKNELEELCSLLGIMDVNLDEFDNHQVINYSTCTQMTADEKIDSFPSVSSLYKRKRDPSPAPQKPKRSKEYNRETGYFSDGTFLKECSPCLRFFVTESSYLSHIENCKNQRNSTLKETTYQASVAQKDINLDSSPKTISNNSSSNDTNLLTCGFCDAIFVKTGNFKKHVFKHFHSLDHKLPKKKPFKCPDCSKIYKTPVKLLQHYFIYHRHILKYFNEKDLKLLS